MSSSSSCCICLDVFTRPVSLPCGHVFCRSCIGDCWRVKGQYLCPLCKTCFQTRPELKVQDTGLSQSDGDQGGGCQVLLRAGEVPCDVCTRPRPALRSCVTCLESYCDLHLQPHREQEELWRHLLVDVEKNLEGALCGAHGRPLQRFCRTDQTCICDVCTRSDHRGHRVVTVRTEAARKKVYLKRKRALLSQRMQEKLKEMEELKRSSEQENHKDLMMELEEEVTEIQRRQEEVEQLLQVEDSLHFLQRISLSAAL